MDHAFHVLAYDCPELFQYPGGGGTLWSTDSVSIHYKPEYRLDEATYRSICSRIHQVIDGIRTSLPSLAGDYEKEKAIHYWLTDHCEYLAAGDDSTAYADACIYYGRAQCSGYARANELLLRAMGISCLNVHSSNHEWNIVNINSHWYHCDTTWDDHEEIAWKSGGNRVAYWFNLPDRLVTDFSHQQIHEPGFTVPACTSIQDNYSYREGIYVQSGKPEPAKYIADSLKAARAAGKHSVSILIDDSGICADWDRILDRIYQQDMYKWVFYPPNDTQTVFAIYNP